MVCLKNIGKPQNKNYAGSIKFSIFTLARFHISLIILLLWQFLRSYYDVLKHTSVSLDERKLNILTAFQFTKFAYLKNSTSLDLSTLQIGNF